MKLAFRIAFALLFFVVLMSTSLATTHRRDKISHEECLFD